MAGIMFVQIDSNPLLGRLEHTTPGRTNYLEAAQRLLSVGGIPLIAVMASQFPTIAQFCSRGLSLPVESLH